MKYWAKMDSTAQPPASSNPYGTGDSPKAERTDEIDSPPSRNQARAGSGAGDCIELSSALPLRIIPAGPQTGLLHVAPTQLRQKKVCISLAGLEVVKVSANHRLFPQFGFSSSASSSTLPVPVIKRK